MTCKKHQHEIEGRSISGFKGPSHTEKQILVVKTEDEDLRWFERSVFFSVKSGMQEANKGSSALAASVKTSESPALILQSTASVS